MCAWADLKSTPQATISTTTRSGRGGSTAHLSETLKFSQNLRHYSKIRWWFMLSTMTTSKAIGLVKNVRLGHLLDAVKTAGWYPRDDVMLIHIQLNNKWKQCAAVYCSAVVRTSLRRTPSETSGDYQTVTEWDFEITVFALFGPTFDVFNTPKKSIPNL